MTSTTDNRTTKLLREGLTEHGIEWRSGLKGVTFVGDWCFVEYENGKLAATCEPVLTPEQAIAATLGSGTCENISNPPEGFLCSACGWGDFAEPSHLLTTAKYAGRVEGGPNYCPNCGREVMGEC